MSRKRFFLCGFVFFFVLGIPASSLYANYVYPLEIFTDNGGYNDSPYLDFYVEVSNGGAGRVDFTFYNESLIDSSIARIYFDDTSLLDIAGITEGAGTSFSQPATPSNLPSGNSLDPPFVTTEEFCFNSGPPRPHSGVNPSEWVRITFDLRTGGTFEDVIDRLNTSALRIGAHFIALPDGSSESAVNMPEPVTICLFGLGVIALLRKRTA